MQRDTAHATPSRLAGDQGIALVEFALVAPLLFTLLLGITTAGSAYNSDIQLTHATREGARFGATIPQNQAFSSGTWATNVRTLVMERSANEFEAADVCVALVRGDTPTVYVSTGKTAAYYSTTGAACYDDSGNGETGLRVQVSTSSTRTIETGFWSTDVTLKANATAKHETPPF